MRWTFIIIGILTSVAALAIVFRWGKRPSNKGKGEVSEFAIVKEVMTTGMAAPMASFALGGQLVSFSVSRQMANHLRVGQQGILTHRGTEFVYFVPRTQMQTGGDNLSNVS